MVAVSVWSCCRVSFFPSPKPQASIPKGVFVCAISLQHRVSTVPASCSRLLEPSGQWPSPETCAFLAFSLLALLAFDVLLLGSTPPEEAGMPVGIVGILAARSKRISKGACPFQARPSFSTPSAHSSFGDSRNWSCFPALLPECRNCNAEILQRDAMPSGGRADIWYLSSLSRTPASVACAQK